MGLFTLLLDGPAKDSEVLAKGIGRILRPFGEITREVQLRAERFAGTNRGGLGAFALPDFARGFEHGLDGIGGDEDAAVVIGENNLAILDLEITEARGPKRVGVPRIEP